MWSNITIVDPVALVRIQLRHPVQLPVGGSAVGGAPALFNKDTTMSRLPLYVCLAVIWLLATELLFLWMARPPADRVVGIGWACTSKHDQMTTGFNVLGRVFGTNVVIRPACDQWTRVVP